MKLIDSVIVRPIRESDFDQLKRLAAAAKSGFTSLPNDPQYLKSKIDSSLRAFHPKVSRPGSESYFFVLENTLTGEVIGTSGIVAKVGGFDPYFTYRIVEEHNKDEALKVDKNLKVLHLSQSHSGPSEICSIFIEPQHRTAGLGRLISLSRFLFISEFSNRFENEIISELRGVSLENGTTPFWDCVGHHFFDTDFSHADFLSGLGHKEFIKNLMPRYPIYIAMLPHSVQAVIGEVHQDTRPARHLLESEGFAFNHEVDIFDAGPTLTSQTKSIRTVKNSQIAPVKKIETTVNAASSYLIANRSLDFRCTEAPLLIDEDGIILSQNTATLLNLTVGQEVRYVTRKS